MTQRNGDILRRWFEEVWNQGHEAAIAEMLTEDCLAHGLGAGGEVTRGVEGFKPFVRQLRGAMPDIRFTIDAVIEEGDLVAARWTARAVHSGDDLGVPATNKPLTITGMTFLRIRDGRIAEGWNNWDMLGMMHAIGLPPAAVAVQY
jgi:steroid delta-isomerase-like uncharacterized protein